MTGRWFAALLFVAGAVAAVPARGEAPPEAMAHEDAGTQAYHRKDFRRAIEEYRKSFALDPTPQMYFNLAQAHRQLGEYGDAIAFYRFYLAAAPPSAKFRGIAERQLRELERRDAGATAAITPAEPKRPAIAVVPKEPARKSPKRAANRARRAALAIAPPPTTSSPPTAPAEPTPSNPSAMPAESVRSDLFRAPEPQTLPTKPREDPDAAYERGRRDGAREAEQGSGQRQYNFKMGIGLMGAAIPLLAAAGFSFYGAGTAAGELKLVPRTNPERILELTDSEKLYLGLGIAAVGAGVAVLSFGLLYLIPPLRAGKVFILPTLGGVQAGGTF